MPPTSPSGTWKTFAINPGGLPKLPEGSQYELKDGMPQLLTDDHGNFILNSQGTNVYKTTTATQQTLEAKRGEAEMAAEGQVSGVKNLIETGRGLTGQPGFEQALALGRAADVGNIPIPYTGGSSIKPAAMGYSAARAANPNSPVWGVMDDIQSLQDRLGFVLGKAFVNNQGQVSNYERELVQNAIGKLTAATSKADFQFRLNSVQRMIEDMNNKTFNKGDNAYTARPSVHDLSTLKRKMEKAPNEKVLNFLVGDFAQKYNVPRDDMADYIMDAFEMIKKQPPPERRP